MSLNNSPVAGVFRGTFVLTPMPGVHYKAQDYLKPGPSGHPIPCDETDEHVMAQLLEVRPSGMLVCHAYQPTGRVIDWDLHCREALRILVEANPQITDFVNNIQPGLVDWLQSLDGGEEE